MNIHDSLINRFKEYKSWISNQDNVYGEFWTEAGSSFNVELTPKGYIDKGKRNYLPILFSVQDNLEILNDYESPFNKNTHIKEKLLTLGDYKFCMPIKSENSTLRYAKYYLELIEKYIPQIQNNTVLEIGAGAGIFSALMQDRFTCRNIIIDIPYSLQNSIALFMTIYQNKTFILPNEITDETNIYDYDLIFLVPEQKILIENNSVGLSINTLSFMEMDESEIYNYFPFISNITTNGGYLFISNRMRKVNIFFKYPFHKLRQFKRLYLSRNNVFLRHVRMSTVIDCILVKDTTKKSSKVFNTIYRFYLNTFWMTREERYGWIRSDVITILRKIGINVRKN